MPHLILETTADLPENGDVPDILEALVEELCRHETVKPSGVKAYHTLRSVWHMGEGAPPGFAHLTLCVLSGRSLEWRKSVADALMKVLKERFEMSLEAKELSLTLEVREMEKESYVNGS